MCSNVVCPCVRRQHNVKRHTGGSGHTRLPDCRGHESLFTLYHPDMLRMRRVAEACTRYTSMHSLYLPRKMQHKCSDHTCLRPACKHAADNCNASIDHALPASVPCRLTDAKCIALRHRSLRTHSASGTHAQCFQISICKAASIFKHSTFSARQTGRAAVRCGSGAGHRAQQQAAAGDCGGSRCRTCLMPSFRKMLWRIVPLLRN